MSLLEFSLVFAFGLASSLHCLSMCGPIVLAYSVSMAQGGALRREVLLAHASYNAGRILTYMALGALAGAAGGGIGMLGGMAGLAAGARVFAGAAMIAAGVLMLRIVPSQPLVKLERRGVTAYFRRAIGRLLVSSHAGGKFTLGLALGFLPCGLIYAALLKSVETARPAAGALTMLAFGLGTAVALFGTGVAGSMAGPRLGKRGNRVAGVSMLAAGAILLWRGLMARAICH